MANKEKNNIKDEFISTLSHEIRTPLTSIKGFSQTMLSSWDKLDEDKKKEFLKIILAQSQRLINLTENVLNVAKIDSNSQDIVLVNVDCALVVKNCIDVVSINYKDFEFKFEPLGQKLSCLSDVNKTQQILINIIDNAAKYSINSKVVEIKVFNECDYNVFSIVNYGSYIEPNKISHIFEKFYRASSYISSATQGSGLGLYIAHELALKMDGKIEVKSDKDTLKTEFLVYLPVYEVEKITKKAINK